MSDCYNHMIDQLKPMLGALSEPILVMDSGYNILLRSGSVSPHLTGNMRPFIELPSDSDESDVKTNVIISADSKKTIGVLVPFGDLKILIFSDQTVQGKNNTYAATRSVQTDIGVDDVDIVYSSEAMRKTVEFANKASDIEATVLLSGETGVGKTFLAKYIHNKSPRHKGPFVAINCGAIPISLMESELFGYERGAFTGADKLGRIGLFESAIGGTVFLDEIGEISKDMQIKILHTIEEKRVVRVGGREQIPLDIRLIAATNRDLAKMVKDGDFREDLFYRLNVISFTIPPLWKRKDDIIALVSYYTQMNNRKYNLNKEFDPIVLDILLEYNWPGNIRELQNSVERMIVMATGDVITEKDLSTNIISFVNNEVLSHVNHEEGILQREKDMLERELIEKALSEHTSIRKAATKLGISHVTLLRKIEKLNVRPNIKRKMQEMQEVGLTDDQ